MVEDLYFKELFSIATQSYELKNHALARSCLLHLMDLPLSFLQFTKVKNLGKLIESDNSNSYNRIKLAILADSTLDHFKQALELNLSLRGFDFQIYQSPFDSIEQEVWNPESGLYSFSPTHLLIFMGTDSLDFKKLTIENQTLGSAEVDRQWASLLDLWTEVQNRLPSCQIIQTTFPTSPERPLGQIESRLPWSQLNLVEELNQRIKRYSEIAVLDLDYLSAIFGKAQWFDRRLRFHSKHAFSMNAISLVCAEFSRLLVAMAGNSRKCLVLDLDNTLWGGVIGDDGLDGIQLGDTTLGEAFVEFQQYLKMLQSRGVILAVCSKNHEEMALSPFRSHPHMVLRREDISCFLANWENKVDNIKEIASTLNIGLDSMAFFDDNPAERKIVRDFLPEVYCVEVPEDPCDYVNALDRLGLFDIAKISQEDTARTAQYLQNSERALLRSKVSNLDDYLISLNMKCMISKISAQNFERPLQLINKSNQFNFMTNRYTESEFRALIATPGIQGMTFRLMDRFGDNGEICTVITEKRGHELWVRDWVMSCRVLARGMESFTLNAIRKLAVDEELSSVICRYSETKKNKLVSTVLPQLGFSLVDETDAGMIYELDLANSEVLRTQIEVVDGH